MIMKERQKTTNLDKVHENAVIAADYRRIKEEQFSQAVKRIFI